MISGAGPGELLGFWGSMVFRQAPIRRKGPGNNNNFMKSCWNVSKTCFQFELLRQSSFFQLDCDDTQPSVTSSNLDEYSDAHVPD